MNFPTLIDVEIIQERLREIFPEGIPRRNYYTREMAAKAVFVMLYINAVEGSNLWLGPKHVYGMTKEQASNQTLAARIEYAEKGWKPGFRVSGERWYADNTREPIRDETLRYAFVDSNAVFQRPQVSITSTQPRYALRSDFAVLFDPQLSDDNFRTAAAKWRETRLSPMVLKRTRLIRLGAGIKKGAVEVLLPNKTTRQLSSGLSSIISKDVIEVFAKQFLREPAVLLLSESGVKIVAHEEELTRQIGLTIDTSDLLPDIILFDLAEGYEVLVFVEVVATDGPVSEGRKSSLLRLAEQADIPSDRTLFLTAYEDRNHSAYRKTFEAIAWNTLVWFRTEPDYILVFRGATSPNKIQLATLLE